MFTTQSAMKSAPIQGPYSSGEKNYWFCKWWQTPHTSFLLLSQWLHVKVDSWMGTEEMSRAKKESVQESKLGKGFSFKLIDWLIPLKHTVWCVFSLIVWFCLACDKITLLQMKCSCWQRQRRDELSLQHFCIWSSTVTWFLQLHLGLICWNKQVEVTPFARDGMQVFMMVVFKILLCKQQSLCKGLCSHLHPWHQLQPYAHCPKGRKERVNRPATSPSESTLRINPVLPFSQDPSPRTS